AVPVFPGNILQAIDGKTGELIWENRYGSNANGAAMRGITIYDDKIYLATSEAHLMAFDARTGKTVWDTTIGDRSKGNYGTSSGPMVANGKVIQGLGGCQTYREEKCFISAYDAKSGKEVWRFDTVASQGQQGGDTWGTLPNLFRAGGQSWITGKYLGHKETVFQNVWDSFDPKTGRPTYRADILEQKFGVWVQGCPSTEGGHNWPASSYHSPTNQLIIPLSQSCLEMNAQKVEQK